MLLLGLTSLLLVCGCTKDKAPSLSKNTFMCDTTVTYTSVVKVIMDTRCGLPTCHDATAPGGGFNLNMYRDCKDIALTHDVLMCTIRHDSCGYKPMPYPMGAPKLSDSLIVILACWVSQGARE